MIYSVLPTSISTHLTLSTGKSFSGREFDAMSDEEQRKACMTARLFSRVEPAHKSKIVEYLQKEGAVSAMVSHLLENFRKVAQWRQVMLGQHVNPVFSFFY